MHNKLDKNKFSQRLGSWYPKIEPLFSNGVMDKIYEELKNQGRKGTKITPDKSNTFRCFRETPIDQIKAVMMGYCPYHSVINGKILADGILMGCSNHKDYLAPSLQQYYRAVEEEFKEGLCFPCVKTKDLTYLSQQGVLMFNSSLTTIVGTAGAHQELWRPFTEHMMKIFNNMDIPIIFLGNDAWEFSDCSNIHYKLSHPASASHRHTEWSSEGVFKKVNEKLEDWFQKPIQWIMETAPF